MALPACYVPGSVAPDMSVGRFPPQPVPGWPGGVSAVGWPGEGFRCSMTRWRPMLAACLLLVLVVPDLAAAASRRVLVLHSFGRDFGPFRQHRGFAPFPYQSAFLPDLRGPRRQP